MTLTTAPYRSLASARRTPPLPQFSEGVSWIQTWTLAAGLVALGDTVVMRGDPAARSFAAFRLRDGVIVAVEAVNAAPEYMMGRRLIAARARVAPERLADKAVPMKEMAS